MTDPEKPSQITSPFLTLREAAAYPRVSTVTLYRLVRTSVLPRTKVGGQYRFLTKDLDAAVAASDASGDENVPSKYLTGRSKPTGAVRRDYAAELRAIVAESKAQAKREQGYR